MVTILDEEQFWQRVEKLANESGCWLWTGNLDVDGYGRLNQVKAHRISYQIHKGDVGNLCVLHHCDTPACVNPDHLYAGTNADNTKDRNRRNRQAKGGRQWCAKLNPALVREIRELSKTLNPRQIADRFGMGKTPINKVIDRITWRHV